MGSLSIWHWIVFAVLWLGFAVPLSRLAKRTGHAQWVPYLVCFPVIPFGSLVYLWMIAFKNWPKVESSNELA